MTLTPAQQQALNEALALIVAVGPELGPNGAIAAAVVQIGSAAITSAMNAGADVTDTQLQALFAQFDVNKADDLQAQQAASKQPSAPETAPALDQAAPKTAGMMGLPNAGVQST